MPQWTDAQRAVLESIRDNTLVSASAGSGKTAVMIERVLRLVTGDNASGIRVPVRRIMMVTFSVAIADELKLRIARALRDRVRNGAADEAEYLREQIEDLPLCDISTLHAMCANLLRSDFERAQVDPSFGILEEESASILFARAVETVIGAYEAALDPQVYLLSKLLGGKAALADKLSKLYAFVVAQPDRDALLDHTAYDCCNADLESSLPVRWFLSHMRDSAEQWIETAERMRAGFEKCGMDKHAMHIQTTIDRLERVRQADTYRAYCDLFARPIAFDRIPTAPKDESARIAHIEYREFNTAIKSQFSSWKAYAADSCASVQASASAQRPYIETLCRLVREIIVLYDGYKRDMNRLDFNDLEYRTLRLLSDPSAAQAIRERYDYICVDEYQDINALQERILRLLSDGSNLFMVGDSKQSIYQFRLTDTQIFLGKLQAYAADATLGKAFALNRNFRSCEPVLQFVNRIFDHVMTERFGGVPYAQTARLEYGNTSVLPLNARPVTVAVFEKQSQSLTLQLPADGVYSVREHAQTEQDRVDTEGLWIAAQITHLVQGTTDGQTDRVTYSDIVLLSMNRSERVERILDTLFACGIPVDRGNLARDHSNRSIELLIAYLQVLDNPKQDFALITVMSSVLGGFSLDELAAIRAADPRAHYFYQAAEAYAAQDALGAKIARFYEELSAMRDFAASAGAADVLRKAIADYRYDAYLSCMDGGENERMQLHAFVDALEDKTYNDSVQDFLEIVRDLPQLAQVADISRAEGNCVRTDTVHGSKGLEYPIVFLIDCGHGFNRQDLYERVLADKDCGIAVQDVDAERMVCAEHPIYRMLQEKKHFESTEERLRLFYVALTRAQRMLVVTGTGKLSYKPCRQANCFLDWIAYACERDATFEADYLVEPNDLSVLPMPEMPSVTFRTPDPQTREAFRRKTRFEYPYESATRMRIKHSVTAINHNTSTPDGQEALPMFGRDKTQDGIAYHRVLECIDYGATDERAVRAELDDMVAREQLTAEQASAVDPALIARCLSLPVMEYARTHRHLREKDFMLNVPADRILPDSDVRDCVLLQGTVDLLITGEQTVLVDFKYSARSADYLIERYRQQLELYAMAIESCTGLRVDRKVIVSLARGEEIEI